MTTGASDIDGKPRLDVVVVFVILAGREGRVVAWGGTGSCTRRQRLLGCAAAARGPKPRGVAALLPASGEAQ